MQYWPSLKNLMMEKGNFQGWDEDGAHTAKSFRIKVSAL